MIGKSCDGRLPRFFDTDPSSLHILYPKKGDGGLSNEKPTYTKMFDAPPIRMIPSPTIGKKDTGPPYSICPVPPGTRASNCVGCIGVQGLGLKRIECTNGTGRARSLEKKRPVRVGYRFISR